MMCILSSVMSVISSSLLPDFFFFFFFWHTHTDLSLFSILIVIIVWINLKLSYSAIVFIVYRYLLAASTDVLVSV